MKLRHFTLAIAAAAALSLGGCFQVERTLQLNADGSGTIVEKVSLSAGALSQMKALTSFGGAPAPGDKPAGFELADEGKLKEEAAKMGEGVKFVSVKKSTDADREGYVATFSFTDINKVKLDTNPPDLGPKGGTGGLKINSKSGGSTVGFAFAKGKPAELTVTLPPAKKEPAKSKEEEAADAAQNALAEGMMGMMQQMFKDMRIAMAIEVNGKIVKTNAQFQDGSRVTLADLDFNKLLADPAKFKAMSKIKDPNSAEGRAFLRTVPGIKIETAEPLKISFQ